MKTLIIFDNNGTIYYQATGDITEPAGGVNFIWVDVPSNSYVESIDMSSGEPIAIIKEFESSREDVLQEQINDINDVLLELILQKDEGYRMAVIKFLVSNIKSRKTTYEHIILTRPDLKDSLYTYIIENELSYLITNEEIDYAK